MLLLWGPSRIHKELRNFCVQELITCLHQLDVHCSPQTDFQSVDVDEDSLLVSCKDPIKGIVEAACKCVLLTAVLQVSGGRQGA